MRNRTKAMTPTRLTRERLDEIRAITEATYRSGLSPTSNYRLLHQLLNEIDALEAERDKANALADSNAEACNALSQEIDRLRAERTSEKCSHGTYNDAYVNSLRAEVARLHDKYDCQRLVKRVSELEAALEECAEPNRYNAPCVTCGPKTIAYGCYIARNALAKLREKDGEK